jgi:hypothetical protein
MFPSRTFPSLGVLELDLQLQIQAFSYVDQLCACIHTALLQLLLDLIVKFLHLYSEIFSSDTPKLVVLHISQLHTPLIFIPYMI